MRLTAAVVVATALALGACGTSKEDEAKQQVCDARADIEREVNDLKQQTPSTVTLDAVKQSVQAIGDDLRKMGDAQADLSDERRSEVQKANEAFAAQIREIGSTVLRSSSVEEAQAQLETAVTDLQQTYGATLAKVDCG
jgi:Tfp pilus assembly protein PilP